MDQAIDTLEQNDLIGLLILGAGEQQVTLAVVLDLRYRTLVALEH